MEVALIAVLAAPVPRVSRPDTERPETTARGNGSLGQFHHTSIRTDERVPRSAYP